MRRGPLFLALMTLSCGPSRRVTPDPAPEIAPSVSVPTTKPGVAEPSFDPAPSVPEKAKTAVARKSTTRSCQHVFDDFQLRRREGAGACSNDDDCTAYFEVLSKNDPCTCIAANRRQAAWMAKLVDEARTLGCAVEERCFEQPLVASHCTNGACRYR